MPNPNNTWFQTYTGKIIEFGSIESCPINIEDIAHALSNISRWGGHTRSFYSVAQHCVEVSMMLNNKGYYVSMCGLLHDAAEAYVGDMTSPLKRFIRTPLPGDDDVMTFDKTEAMFHDRIGDTFGLAKGFQSNELVKWADSVQLCREARDLFDTTSPKMSQYIESLDCDVSKENGLFPLDRQQAKDAFMERYKELKKHKYDGRLPSSDDRCPCMKGKPSEACSSNCTCAYPLKSGGCYRCSTYGERKPDTIKPSAIPTTPDLINHPPHYISKTGLQAIDVIEAFDLGFNLGNVAKYVLRSGSKGNMLQDLQKARWYLDREIESLEDDNTP